MSPPVAIDPELLLSHRAFVGALARGVLSADDVVQQTFLAALQSPPRETSRLRSFLAVSASNFARRAARDVARRERLLRAVPPQPSAVPSAEEILEQEALRKRVVDATLALDEPYRA